MWQRRALDGRSWTKNCQVHGRGDLARSAWQEPRRVLPARQHRRTRVWGAQPYVHYVRTARAVDSVQVVHAGRRRGGRTSAATCAATAGGLVVRLRPPGTCTFTMQYNARVAGALRCAALSDPSRPFDRRQQPTGRPGEAPTRVLPARCCVVRRRHLSPSRPFDVSNLLVYSTDFIFLYLQSYSSYYILNKWTFLVIN